MHLRKYDQHEDEMARPPAVEKGETVRLALNVGSVGLTDDQFLRLCSDNHDLRIEIVKDELSNTPWGGGRFRVAFSYSDPVTARAQMRAVISQLVRALAT